MRRAVCLELTEETWSVSHEGTFGGNAAMPFRLYITYWFFRRKLRIAILAVLTYAALC